jgi:hypothetical protein
MYFDQLGKPPQKPELDSEGIPVGLDLSSTACNPEQLKRVKDILRKHAEGFAAVNGRPSLVRGYEFGVELLPDAKPVRHMPRRQMRSGKGKGSEGNRSHDSQRNSGEIRLRVQRERHHGYEEDRRNEVLCGLSRTQ